MTRQLVAPPVMPGHVHAEEPDATRAGALELLSRLLRYPLLRASDLAILLELSASATAARLARAQEDGYVRSASASLLGRQVARLHALTPRGLAALAERDGVVWQRARRCQADTAGFLQLLADFPAVLTTQVFVLALIAHAEEALCRQPSQRFTWSWTRHVRLRSLSTVNDQHTDQPSLRGDAGVRLVLRSAIQGAVISYRLMILWDSGLARPQDIRRQFQLLLRIRDSYERQGQLTTFPPLLVLAPDARRAALWQAQALRLATERWLTHPLLGGALALDDHAPVLSFPPVVVDSLDPWQAPWRSFAQPGAQRLNDILQEGGTVGVRLLAPWQTPWQTGRLHNGVEQAQLILRLDARSLRMLTTLYLHSLLSTRQLAIVLGIQRASAERMLSCLRRLDLVETQTWSGIPHGALADRGVLLLARCAHLPGGARAGEVSSHPPRVLRRYQREVRSLTRTPDHTAGVYDFFTELFQSCAAERAKGRDAVLLWWETGARCACAFHDAGGWQVIRPDGAGEWCVEDQRFRFWLEWDRGTMGPRDLRAKFAAYARYLQSGEWRVDGNEPLPALLIVITDIAQEARLLDALDATLPDTRDLSVCMAQRDSLIAHGLLAPIWHWYERWMGHSRWSAPRGLMSLG